MAAGATAAAIRAQQMKTKARRSYYGGSQDALDAQRDSYATGIDQGNSGYDTGVRGLQHAGGTGATITDRGMQLLDSAAAAQPSQAGVAPLQSLDPQAVARVRSQMALDQNARATLGMARSGGALGIRQAVAANAAAGVQGAQQEAAMGLEGEQAKAQLLSQNAVQRSQLDQAKQAQLLNAGGQLATTGNAQTLQAASGVGQLGLTNQGQYLNQLQGADQSQLSADINYDTRRQADQQRRAQNLWSLAGTLTGGAAKAFGSIGGGGGG
jgi:hypothetical protein